MKDGGQKKLTPQLPSASFHLLFRCGPALFHQRQQMLQGLLVAPAFFRGELAGALVELRGHPGGFLRRTAEGGEHLSQLRNLHGLILAALKHG